jgi:hypothetical protein
MVNLDVLSGMSHPSLFALCFSSALVYILVTSIYRLFFHPLASFPGPFWARLSVIPSWWHTRLGDRHIWLHSLQEKYGRPASVMSADSLVDSQQALNFGTVQTASC